jgi:hypothetical protein
MWIITFYTEALCHIYGMPWKNALEFPHGNVLYEKQIHNH